MGIHAPFSPRSPQLPLPDTLPAGVRGIRICWKGGNAIKTILSGTISFDFVPDSCVVGTEWYLNVPGGGLGYPFGYKIILKCAGRLEVGNNS